jgi:hypothetical protein
MKNRAAQQPLIYESDENDEHDAASHASAPSPSDARHQEIGGRCSSPHGDDVDEDERLARSRDRNREHARRTRLRKKKQLQILQERFLELQGESKILKQTIEECSIASILLGLSTGERDICDDFLCTDNLLSSNIEEKKFITVTGKRKRFVSDADCDPVPMKLRIKGKDTQIGGSGCKAQINWKTGLYIDENGIHQQLSDSELESLRRERNRMHAKMTRDRKKLYINKIEKTISDLEEKNMHMRSVLVKQAKRHAFCVSPEISPIQRNVDSIPSITKDVSH